MKRIFDFILTILLAPLWLPILMALTIINAAVHGWPPFFVQERGGLNGSVIKVYKLRSMTNARDGQGNLLPDPERITKFGGILRKLTLDEVPLLLNVLQGRLSLVGPRPLMAKYLPRYSFQQARRHEVRPGLTGWAVVKGRNSLSWEERFKLDVWYVDNRSFWLDVKILFMTVWLIIRRKGVSAEGHATMPEFGAK